MKKILFIMPNKGYSGAEKVVIDIINNLKNEFEFAYVSQNGEISSYLEENNIRHIVTNKKLNKRELKEIIRCEKPDIIHATDYRASVMASMCTNKNTLISHLHNNPPWIKKVNINSLMYLWASRKFKYIFTVSESIQNEYIFSKFIKNKIKLVSNPMSRRDVLININQNEKKIYDICYVARLYPQKNPLKFIDIVYEVKKVKKDISVIMIGNGELKDKVNKEIIKLELEDNIKLIGFKKNPYKEMSKSKIFCLTSDWEGFGLVAFEAITLGLPSIVSNVGGLPNIVDNKCGKLCNTFEDFYLSIIELLQDKKIYNKKSIEAVRKSKEIENISKYSNKIKNLYNSCLLR